MNEVNRDQLVEKIELLKKFDMSLLPCGDQDYYHDTLRTAERELMAIDKITSVDEIKESIGFMAKQTCDNCANCSRYEKDANAPIIMTCNVNEKLGFEVDSDSFCRRWEDL